MRAVCFRLVFLSLQTKSGVYGLGCATAKKNGTVSFATGSETLTQTQRFSFFHGHRKNEGVQIQ